MISNDKSWVIKTYINELLNFIIFTGCMFNLIDDENFDEHNKPWPNNLFNSNIDSIDSDKLKSQWGLWLNEVIDERYNNIDSCTICTIVNEKYDTSNFSQLEYTELRECCKKAYPYFNEWWNMQAGGSTAMSFYEFIGNNEISEYVSELEYKVNRKAKPFKLHLDIVYTGIPSVLDVNDEYIVITSYGYFNLSKSWWINKLSNLI
ncbi:MAG: hypothetical protein ACRCYC_11055 [Paraclostridium sp.]|uniref:hypothetical protein n=1 Tax=Paraclostridium sp. TaxID=2023273 RepID=UPI003F2E8A93